MSYSLLFFSQLFKDRQDLELTILEGTCRSVRPVGPLVTLKTTLQRQDFEKLKSLKSCPCL